MNFPLGCVKRRNPGFLQGLFPAHYKVTNVIKSGSPVSLNPNHTHYIFVDEGYRRRYGGCKSAEVRSALERRIAQPTDSEWPLRNFAFRVQRRTKNNILLLQEKRFKLSYYFQIENK